MARKKTWNEKLHDAKDLPKVITVEPETGSRWPVGRYVVPAPVDVDAVMRGIPRRKLMTTEGLRQALAARYETDFACPLTTGIFSWIAAQAAVEAEESGAVRGGRGTPWWRTLKTGGELNPKFPGGPDRQRQLLEAEGHEVVTKGKKYVVLNYSKSLYQPASK
ncbi:MAG: MGMT family protein [Planctomycetota bacterium]|nr:MAG: MGMT family protein [Planctomycetota bacterium]